MDHTFQKECGADAVYTESTCEYVLPDYQGDIKKILCAEARTIPSGKYAGGSDVEFAGVVAFDVLYTDSEGKLTDATFTSDYEVSLPISAEDYLDAAADTTVQNLSLRLSGPRKITAKCALATRVSLRENDSIVVGGDGFLEGRTPEVKEESIRVRSRSFGNSGEREYADELAKLEGIPPEQVEVIAAGGSVTVNDAEGVEGGVLLRGVITFHAIVKSGDQPPFGVKKEIPFEEMISITGAAPHDAAVASAHLSSVSTAVNADAEGGSAITVSGVAEYTAAVDDNTELSVATDAYLKEAESDAVTRDFRYEEFLTSAVGTLTVGGEYQPKEDEDVLRDIFLTTAQIRTSEKHVEKNAVTVDGECHFHAVGCAVEEDGQVSYGNVKFSVPFSETVRLPISVPEDAKIECVMIPTDATAELYDGGIRAQCRVMCTISVGEEKNIRILESLNVGEAYEDAGRETKITVCYPVPEDTLWNVAKRYHTSVAKVAVDNALTEETMSHAGEQGSLSGIRKLFIR